jgi:hypothetical protein
MFERLVIGKGVKAVKNGSFVHWVQHLVHILASGYSPLRTPWSAAGTTAPPLVLMLFSYPYLHPFCSLLFKDPDVTISAQCCCGALWDVCATIKEKCPSMLMRGCHMSRRCSSRCGLHCPGYAMRRVDFHCVQQLKKVLSGCRFRSDKDIKVAVVQSF